MYFGNLPEEYLLILVDDDTGEMIIQNDNFIEMGLAGGMLLELVIKGRLTVRKNDLIVIDDAPLEGDELVNEALSIMAETDEVQTALYWIRRLIDHFHNLKKRYIQRLIDKEILEKEKEKFLFFFTRTKFKITNPQYEEIVKQNISNAVLVEKEPGPRTLAFLSLIYATNATGSVFSPEELETHLDKIRGMVGGEEIGKSISEHIQNVIDALMRNYIVTFPYAY